MVDTNEIKKTPDKLRAKDLIEMAKERLKIIIPATPKETMYKFLEEYYETAVQLITALMYSEGLKTLNHIGLIQYLKKYNEFSKQEIFILDQMRKFRHGTIYYGRKESGDFFINNEEAIKRIINKLLKISERLKWQSEKQQKKILKK